MSATPPPGYTPPPADLPQRGDRATFSNRVDAWVLWFTTVILTQLAAMIANAYANAVDAFNSTTAAAGSAAAALTNANNAAASAAAATATVNAVMWVSGTTYAQYANVISPLNAATYRRKTAAGSGTTDPASDPTNYTRISAGVYPRLKVSHRLASGTGGGAATSATWNTRPFNTTDLNTIAGASVSGNDVTLPAGTYKVNGRAPASNAATHQVAVYNTTDSTYPLVGSSAATLSGANAVSDSTVEGQFTITATKVFNLRHWTNTGGSVTLGTPVSATGVTEVYAELTFEQVS